eukprot:s232_g9.t1
MADIEGSAREPLATAEEARATAKCSRCRLLGAVVGLLVVAAGAGATGPKGDAPTGVCDRPLLPSDLAGWRCLLGPTCHQSHDRAAPNCGLRYTAVSRFPCQTAEAERSTGETIDRPSAIKRKRLRSAVVTEEPESKRCCSEWNDLVLEFPTGETLQTTSMPLRMSSPDNRIKVDVASPADFAAFCSMMRPGAWSASNVNEDNVEGLLSISDYYQVDFVKEACEARLLAMPLLPLPRLLQAQRYGLKKLDSPVTF